MFTRTDWDRYYTSVPFTARLTRRYSTRVLLDAIKRHALPSARDGSLSIVEIGGANSCFMDAIISAVRCHSYHVVDTNSYGLSLLEKRIGNSQLVRLHQRSVLDSSLDVQADLVFSVGLVEHFNPTETHQAVLAHFDMLRSNGVARIAFPTPTLLYRGVRTLIETVGMWKFPDERPLQPSEVLATVQQRGAILERKTMWPLLLTQHLIVARQRNGQVPCVEV